MERVGCGGGIGECGRALGREYYITGSFSENWSKW